MKAGLLFFSTLIFSMIFLSCSPAPEDTNRILTAETSSAPFFRIFFDPDKPGCGDCHSDSNRREYSLAAKANREWEDHNFDINGELMSINDCLLCHSVDSDGKEGAIAPTPLRTIVHRGHMSSPHFLVSDSEGNKIQGSCFTCHYIMGDSSPDLYNYSD